MQPITTQGDSRSTLSMSRKSCKASIYSLPRGFHQGWGELQSDGVDCVPTTIVAPQGICLSYFLKKKSFRRPACCKTLYLVMREYHILFIYLLCFVYPFVMVFDGGASGLCVSTGGFYAMGTDCQYPV